LILLLFYFHNQDQLQAEIAKTNLENEAFVKVFGKEHGGFARSMELGVTPSQLTTTRSASLTSSSESNEKMKQMQAEIDSLKDKASQVDILKEQVAFLLQTHNSKENQVNCVRLLLTEVCLYCLALLCLSTAAATFMFVCRLLLQLL
jgi:hypothetical protein